MDPTSMVVIGVLIAFFIIVYMPVRNHRKYQQYEEKKERQFRQHRDVIDSVVNKDPQ